MITIDTRTKKEIFKMKVSGNYSTGDIIRTFPGVSKRQIKEIIKEMSERETTNG